jgi:hypothetical protein
LISVISVILCQRISDKQNIKHSKQNFNEKKNKIKVPNFSEKKLCYEKVPKFEQHFELVPGIVTLILLTRKSIDNNTTWE